ncbi:hypothetical protein IB024_01835 [Brucella sp. 6810]|uniref:hypothetical protein n=1 Tax=Brucella sp. 6810 TaxID=2769351 RepID=UPI00165CA60D|nr:hypothetical protein [Brucella sp. 6810]QNQ62524.1 hypothetical protein IB024_01835 [Brucella sp. 6810]
MSRSENDLENVHSTPGQDALARGTAVLATCIVKTLDEQLAGFQEKFLERLETAHQERRHEADSHANELELYTWVHTLLTGFSWSSGKGDPFFKD